MSGTGPNFQNVGITEVPPNWRVPGTYVQVSPSYSQMGLFAFPARALIVGQMLAAGAGMAGQIYQLISAAQAANLFGFGSSAHRMATAFLAANASIPVDIVAYSDPVGGTKATASFVVAKQPSAPGSIVINVAGQMVPVTLDPIVDSTTALTAAAIAAALNTSGLPLRCTATVSGSTVSLTALHAGVYGNDLYVNAPSWPGNNAPTALSITPTGAIQFTNGAGVIAPATLATLFAAIANTWYTDIAFSFNDSTSLAALCAQLEEYYTAMGMKDASAWLAINGTYGSLPGSVSTFNEKCQSVMGLQGCYSPPDEWSASICGAASYASLIDPAKQFRNITLPGIVGPDPANVFTETEQNLLLNDGISTFTVAGDGSVQISRLISTYLTTPQGYPDTAWLDMMRSKVMTRVRWDWKAYRDTIWGDSKLTDDGSVAAEYDPQIATPSRVKASWIARSGLYEQNGWLEETATFGRQAVFERDPNDQNKLLARLPCQIVGNLIVEADLLTFQA